MSQLLGAIVKGVSRLGRFAIVLVYFVLLIQTSAAERMAVVDSSYCTIGGIDLRMPVEMAKELLQTAAIDSGSELRVQEVDDGFILEAAGLGVLAIDGEVARIWTDDRQFRFANGIGIGTDMNRIRDDLGKSKEELFDADDGAVLLYKCDGESASGPDHVLMLVISGNKVVTLGAVVNWP